MRRRFRDDCQVMVATEAAGGDRLSSAGSRSTMISPGPGQADSGWGVPPMRPGKLPDIQFVAQNTGRRGHGQTLHGSARSRGSRPRADGKIFNVLSVSSANQSSANSEITQSQGWGSSHGSSMRPRRCGSRRITSSTLETRQDPSQPLCHHCREAKERALCLVVPISLPRGNLASVYGSEDPVGCSG